jgi:hypothetical protein
MKTQVDFIGVGPSGLVIQAAPLLVVKEISS